MKISEIQIAIDKDALFNKSKIYIQRAFKAKNIEDIDQYQFWASLALELLGKACLAKIHPCLIVDPNNHISLLASTGINLGTDIKTITWKTLFSRLEVLSNKFDHRVKDFCDAMAQRRNAELHSGEVPFKAMLLEAWEARYWHATQLILEMMDLGLVDWLEVHQAEARKEIIQAFEKAMVDAALIRLQTAKENFLKLKPSEQKEKKLITENKKYYHFQRIFSLIGTDEKWEIRCPACQANAFLTGDKYEEIVLDVSDPEFPWHEDVEKHFYAEEFRCLVCERHLYSHSEIEAAGIDPNYVTIEMREREYEEEYGND